MSDTTTTDADTFKCKEHGDECVTVAECAENQGLVFNYPRS